LLAKSFLIGLATGCIYILFGLFLNSYKVHLIIIFVFSFVLGCLALGWIGIHLAVIGEFARDRQIVIATGLSPLFAITGTFIAPQFSGLLLI
jgi:ABC-type polysaccharide/polyol phosphate export permease